MSRAKRIFRGKYRHYFYALAALVVISLAAIMIGSIAPGNFPVGTIVTVKDGMTISETADLLAQKGLIKSVFLYKAYVIMLHDGYGVRAGEYLFDKPQSALRIAYRTAYGVEDMTKTKVTIPEGLASSDMARLLQKYLCGSTSQSDNAVKPCSFRQGDFLTLAKPREGYLFPDTYFFSQNASAEDVFNQLRSNFDSHVNGLSLRATLSGRSFSDVLKMASILEEEASSTLDRRIIAGILWKRLDSGMALQVDAPFFYTLGKTSAELTLGDLSSDSPYNLYKNKGLPPTPIDNPGLDAIYDALYPTKTDYWFYLADKNGITHYSVTFDGHDANKQKYIN